MPEAEVIRLKDKKPETISFLKSVAAQMGASVSINIHTRAMHKATRKVIEELLEKGEITFATPPEDPDYPFSRVSFNLIQECETIFPLEEFGERMRCYITGAKALKNNAT